MCGRLIALYKYPSVRLIGIGETWRGLFANIVLNNTRPEDTMACQDYQLCARLKVVIDSAVHGVQAIWE